MSEESEPAKRKLFTEDSSREIAANISEIVAASINSVTSSIGAFVLSKTETENQNGEWLRYHPWKTEKPDSGLEMDTTVSNSGTYPTPPEWTKCDGSCVDLAKIYENLPSFVEEVMPDGINSCRKELRRSLQTLPTEQDFNTPHVTEIMNESLTPLDQKVSKKEDEKFTASSLNSSPEDPVGDNFYYFDCEHMLKVYVPSSKLSWFQTQIKSHTRWIKKIKFENYKGKRWVFTPSFRRAEIALLQWPHDESVNDDSTIRILVVRPSEFKAYVRYCGPHFPVIRLPQDEIGAGYARFWIQKIALRLELQFIWMIDDSVLCFFEYHSHRKPPKNSYTNFRKRKFGLVFERIENFVEETVDEEVPIVAMSPKRFNVRNPLRKPFDCKPPQGAVYLNLRKLHEKNIWYRPELKTLEDMIFGYECEQHNLKVFRDNRIHLHDHRWKDTGASSPSVKRRKTPSSSSVEKQEPQSSSSIKKQIPQSSSSVEKQEP